MPRKIATICSASTLAQPVIRALHAYGHDITAISRSEVPSLSALGIKVVVLDYSDEAGLTAALQGVHTVISFMFINDPTAFVSANKTLINAMQSAGVKRFAPSEWGFTKEANQVFSPYPPKDVIWDLAKESGLEITAYRVGSFMNYLAVNSPKPKAAAEGFFGVGPYTLVLKAADLKATIPGTGNEPITMIRTQDIGEFVARSIDFESWEDESGMVGEVTTWNKVVDSLEKVTGKSVERIYTPIETLVEQREHATGIDRTILDLYYIMVNGLLNVKPALNIKVPEVKPMGVEEFLRLWWGA